MEQICVMYMKDSCVDIEFVSGKLRSHKHSGLLTINVNSGLDVEAMMADFIDSEYAVDTEVIVNGERYPFGLPLTELGLIQHLVSEMILENQIEERELLYVACWNHHTLRIDPPDFTNSVLRLTMLTMLNQTDGELDRFGDRIEICMHAYLAAMNFASVTNADAGYECLGWNIGKIESFEDEWANLLFNLHSFCTMYEHHDRVFAAASAKGVLLSVERLIMWYLEKVESKLSLVHLVEDIFRRIAWNNDGPRIKPKF